jgi:hypothetical protein
VSILMAACTVPARDVDPNRAALHRLGPASLQYVPAMAKIAA